MYEIVRTWYNNRRADSLMPASDCGDGIEWIEAEQLLPICMRWSAVCAVVACMVEVVAAGE